MQREFHPAAEIFPLMSDEELQELAADIKAHGQQHPIELLDKKIIDGRNRYLACGIAGKQPRVVHVKGIKDAVAYVLSKNLFRRHLTTSQKAMIAAKAKELFEAAAKGRQVQNLKKGRENPVMENFPQRENGSARDQAGKAVGVSGKTVDAASKVLEQGDKETIKAVEEGKLSVSAAVKQIEAKDKDPEEALKDADGVTVPEKYKAIFAKAVRFEAYANKLSHLKGEISADVESLPEAFLSLEPQKRLAELSMMRHQFEKAVPYLVCPSCGGDDPSKCKLCQKRGWLSRQRARTVPLELRNGQRKKAGLDLLTKTSQKVSEETK